MDIKLLLLEDLHKHMFKDKGRISWYMWVLIFLCAIPAAFFSPIWTWGIVGLAWMFKGHAIFGNKGYSSLEESSGKNDNKWLIFEAAICGPVTFVGMVLFKSLEWWALRI
jgi:hypothetical protein